MGSKRLNALRQRWRAESFAYCGLLAVAGCLPLAVLLHSDAGWPWWVGLPIGVVAGVFVLWGVPYWRMSVADIARYLDRCMPELEESCGLLLRDRSDLGLLERLQAGRVQAKLEGLVVPDPVRRKVWFGVGWLAAAVLLSVGVAALAGYRAPVRVVWGSAARGLSRPITAPGIRSVRIRVTPPAYTGRVAREQGEFPLQVEEGAVVAWEVETDAAVDTIAFIFNDSSRVLLQAADAGHTLWRLTEKGVRSGFYQVRTGRRLSPLYPLDVRADEPPQVTIQTPKPYTVVDYGEPTRLALAVLVKDDFGIADASVVATVSSGQGEAVKFKQRELRWNERFGGDRTAYALSKTLDLDSLGLKPGDELYFFCRAKDSRGQEGRTETYIISLTDTARLMNLEGIAMSTDVKPEFFRSERQIIIETEQLLREKDTLAVKAFREKSNDLGIDQKLLRLRYGKFLGEEAEEGERGGGGAGDTTDFGAFGDATKILDVFTDKHDNAEDATYFEPAVKQQLKATLSEMWKAELQLRTYAPKNALPFAYKALRLLKDLQQQSRVYVAKTGAKVTPLNPAKRLTGELAAIQAPVQAAAGGGEVSEEELLRMALAVLEGRRAGLEGGPVLGSGDKMVMRRAAQRVGREAVVRPGVFLGAYEVLKAIMENGGGGVDAVTAERAIRRLLPVAESAPAAAKGMADGGLGNLYFQEIGR